jgi:hypothetical protein
MDSKVIISLVSVALGTVLSQLATIGREHLTGRKLKQGLLIELGDLQVQLERMMVITQRQLQLLANQGIDCSAFSLPLSNLFFKTYFKDVFGKLNADQRNSYQLIHSVVNSINHQSESLRDTAEKIRDDMANCPEKLMPAKFKRWEEDLITFYKGVMVLRWHIDYHQKFPIRPNYEILGESHEAYLVFIKELDESVKNILETSKGISRHSFESRTVDIETIRRLRNAK